MSLKSTAIISLLSILAIIIGGVLGYYQPGFAISISFLGTLFINGLKIIIFPLLISLIVTGISAMGNYRKINRSLGKTLLYFVSTGAVASLVGIITAYVIQPGLISNREGAFIPSSITGLYDLSFSDILGSILPENFIRATAEGQILGLVIFSILFAIALTSMGRSSKIVLDFFSSVKEISIKLVHYFLYIAPLGLLALSADAVAGNYENSVGVLTSLSYFTLTVVTGLLFFLVVVLPLALKIYAKKSPLEFFGNLLPAITTGLASGSSAATFPVTYDCVTEKSGIDNRASAFVLPMGTVINLNGTAIYLGTAAIFIAQLYGVNLSVLQILIVLGGSLLLSIGSTLIPHTSLLVLGVLLSFADFPPQAFAGIGLLLVLDWMFERMRAVVNIAGDAVGAAIISETFEFKTARETKLGTPKKKISTIRGKGTRDRHSIPKKEDYPAKSKVRKTTKRTLKTGARTKVDHKIVKKNVDPTPKTDIDMKSPFVMPEIPYHTLEKEYHARSDKPENSIQAPAEKNVSKTAKTQIKTPSPKVPPPKAPKIPVPPYIKKPVENKFTEKPKTKTDTNQKNTEENISMSPETIERERARISAQLAAMKEREKNKNYLKEGERVTQPPVDSDTVEKTIPGRTLPYVDFIATDSENDPAADEQIEDTPIEPISHPVQSEKFREAEVKTSGEISRDKTEAISENTKVESDSKTAVLEAEAEIDKQIMYGRKKPKRKSVKKSGENDSVESSKNIAPENSEKEKDENPDTTDSPEIPSSDKDTYAKEEMSFGRSKRKK